MADGSRARDLNSPRTTFGRDVETAKERRPRLRETVTAKLGTMMSFRFRIPNPLFLALRREYRRLVHESNGAAPLWDDYLSAVLIIGGERLKTMSEAEALVVLEREMFG